jgi:putative restriction endonuclease
MAQTRKTRIERLLQGIESGGGRIAAGLRVQDQPMGVSVDGDAFRIFSWAISHGGKGRSPDEYRVQTTRPNNMPLLDPGGRTLLLGYHEELDVFAAWDVRVHPNPSSSASLQVPLTVLRRAAEEGFVSHSRHISGEAEIVVAFQPEAVMTYLAVAARLPGPGASDADLEAAAQAGSGEAVPVTELPEDVERRREIREIEVKVRDQRFRQQVIAAYGGRCAFCGLGGGLAEAAHVEAVAEGGPDLVVNGLASCPTHHTAFDRGLITVGSGYAIEFNEERLRANGSDDGEVEGFQGALLGSLALPAAVENHPDAERLAAHRGRWR